MSPKRKADLAIEHTLLGFVQRQPLHAYEIYQQLGAAQALGLVWHIKQAHLYALLDRLEMEGLLVAEVVPQAARPAKRLLQLTAAGRTAFARWLQTPVQHGRDLRIEFLAKLFWAQQDGPAATQRLIAQQRAACEGWLREIQDERATLDSQQPYAMLVLQFRISQTEAMLRWLNECAATLAPAAFEQG
jgi:DNA-binding PadR family transcriptional regulator